jgi:antitoxin component YwqK of YwqJK toxin-antitoxin module
MAIALFISGISYWLIEFWLVKRRAATTAALFLCIGSSCLLPALLNLEKLPVMMKPPFKLLSIWLLVFSALTGVSLLAQKGPDSLRMDNRMFYGKMTSGKPSASWVAFFPSGQLAEIRHYEGGVQDGIVLALDANGFIVKQGFYSKGLKEGRWLQFRPGGRIAGEENYTGDKLNGWKIGYYDNGAVREKAQYSNDLRNGTTYWMDEKGNPIAEYNYANNLFHGIQWTWYPGGVLKSESHFENNVQHGLHKEYYSNGNARTEGEYTKGRKTGTWVEWNPDGSVKSKELMPE